MLIGVVMAGGVSPVFVLLLVAAAIVGMSLVLGFWDDIPRLAAFLFLSCCAAGFAAWYIVPPVVGRVEAVPVYYEAPRESHSVEVMPKPDAPAVHTSELPAELRCQECEVKECKCCLGG